MTQPLFSKNTEKLLSGTNYQNRTSMQNYKQCRMYFYDNHLRHPGDASTGPVPNADRAGGDLNNSVNFPSHSRTQADNFISGQNNQNQTITDRSHQLSNSANKIGGKYQQVLSKARHLADSGSKQQQLSNASHR